uniref:Uncharacterized protein n=1 Tax=Setaria viridis TaxID=4556 RepID=A0A4V6DA02_SETVI|nr:hypothetical protein SEVIR_3G301100v2 [Setaria viridis]
MTKLVLGLYDYRSKHHGILEEIHAMTPTNLHLDHFNHEGVVESFGKIQKIDMQSKYDAATILVVGNLSPFFGLEELRTTPFQEEQDDVHMPCHSGHIDLSSSQDIGLHPIGITDTIESRMTPFQEGDDEDIPAILNTDALVTPDASLVMPSPTSVTHQESSET